MQKFLSLFIVGLVTVLLTGCGEENGEKIGRIVTPEPRGVFNETWESTIYSEPQVLTAQDSKTHPSDRLRFTIDDPDLLREVSIAGINHLPVRITYQKRSFSFWNSDSGGVFITSIEPMNFSGFEYEPKTAANPVEEVPGLEFEVIPPVNTTTTVMKTETISSGQMLLAIKALERKQDELEKNQKLMQQMLDKRSKK